MTMTIVQIRAALVLLAGNDMDMATAPGHAEGVAALRNAHLTGCILAGPHVHPSVVHGEELDALHVAMLRLVQPWVPVWLVAQVPAISKQHLRTALPR